MKKFLSEQMFCRIFLCMAVVVFGIIFHYSLAWTGVNTEIESEYIDLQRSSILLNIVKIGGGILVLYFLGKLSKFFQSKRSRNILLGICCLISFLISLYWVLNSGTGPQGDQRLIVRFANELSTGNYDSIQQGGYMAVYSQQLGIVTFLRLIFFLFGAENYVAFQIFLTLMVPLILFAGCMIVRELSDNDSRVELYYLFLGVTCFPMYAYTSFVYNDLISVPFILLSVRAMLSCMRKFHIWKLIGMGVSAGLSVMFRTNIIIVVIAMLIVMVVKLLSKRDWQLLVMGVSVIAGVLIFQVSVKALYSSQWGEDAHAVPALCYIAMGLNDDYGHPGWHNNYEIDLFADCGYNVDAANAEALSTLKMYANIYRAQPEYMIDFFVRKMNAQWNAPMYQCIVMNNFIVDEQSNFVQTIYEGKGFGLFMEKYAKVYQLLFYGSILFLLINKRKDWKDIEKYVLLIAIFGGFLFSLIWEAKTRYVFPYLLMGIPYMALGINELTGFLSTRIQRKRSNADTAETLNS